jgi:hypothetical protein
MFVCSQLVADTSLGPQVVYRQSIGIVGDGGIIMFQVHAAGVGGIVDQFCWWRAACVQGTTFEDPDMFARAAAGSTKEVRLPARFWRAAVRVGNNRVCGVVSPFVDPDSINLIELSFPCSMSTTSPIYQYPNRCMTPRLAGKGAGQRLALLHLSAPVRRHYSGNRPSHPVVR